MNLDGQLNQSDLTSVLNGLFQESSNWNDGDANGDGVVDASDFNIVNTALQSTPANSSVPEPSGLFLLTPVLAFASMRRFRI